jgi:hypothetical protein
MGNFLVRLGDLFLVKLFEYEFGEEPLWDVVPSVCAHFDYQTADQMCQQLRSRGFHAIVTDVYGGEADVDCIQRDGRRVTDVESGG